MENYTTHVNLTKIVKQKSSLLADWAVVNAALNIFLAITATLGNILILIALYKVSSIHPPTKLLFRCLAFTDLCVGLTVEPLFVITELNVAGILNLNSLSYVVKVQQACFILCGVSMFASTALGVDRLLALKLGLRYRHVVTLRRIRSIVIFFWLTGVFGAFMSITIGAVPMILSVFISLFSCTKIFLKLRQHQAQVHHNTHHEQPNGGGVPVNIAQYKKTVYSILYIQLALAACYVPYIIVVVIVVVNECCGNTGIIVLRFTETLYLLNSLLNPIIYCWRIKEVRLAVKDTIKRLCCSTT